MPSLDNQSNPGIKTFLSWIQDTHTAFRDSRLQSLIDAEVFDGKQWTAQQVAILSNELGIQPLTINKTFPAVNMILGSQLITKHDIIAKGRTAQDSSENLTSMGSSALKFVSDQNEGTYKRSEAFKDAVVPGFGCIEVLKNSDPRHEVVKLAGRKWQEMGWDPHGTPWFEVDTCRYVYNQKWVDIGDLIAIFPKKKEAIENAYGIMLEHSDSYYSISTMSYDDEDDEESYWESLIWIDNKRKRVQPVQMWYTIWEKAIFASFPDGRAIELTDNMPFNEQYQLVLAAQEVLSASVKKMRVATFLGNTLLQDIPSPHNHDLFPYVPFIGYLDRFRRPFGVPRQIRDMDLETNKRRTSTLAKMNARRIFVEDGVVKDLSKLRTEAQRPDGLIVVKKNKLLEKRLIIEDHEADIRANTIVGQESEREIQEISGAVSELMGYESNLISGKALEEKQRAGATTIASLFENLERSDLRLGELKMAGIQQYWEREKVVRVTDSFKGSDKLIVFNQAFRDEETDTIKIKNNISQIKFDFVIAKTPQTDTMREKQFEILIEAVKISPPEVIPLLLDIAFEQIDIPNKEVILARIRQTFNLDIPDEELTKEQIAKQMEEQRAAEAEKEEKVEGLQMEEQALENEKILAQIKRLLAQAELDEAQAEKLDTETEIAVVQDTRDDEMHDVELKVAAKGGEKK